MAELNADGPLFPEGAGEVIHSILNPEPSNGPPYTHTFRYPPTEYDDEGNPLPAPIEPAMTVLPPLRPEPTDPWRIALRQQIAATHPKPIITGAPVERVGIALAHATVREDEQRQREASEQLEPFTPVAYDWPVPDPNLTEPRRWEYPALGFGGAIAAMAAFAAGTRALLDTPGLRTDEVERLKTAIQELATAMRRPAPNPAARDYRRRTKRRRRRARR